MMDGVIRGGDDDLGEGMQCSDHPFRNNPGGICAFCLQEKLGKLVSSSFPNAIFPSSSSSSPSFRSEIIGGGGVALASSTSSLSVRPTTTTTSSSSSKDCHYHGYYSSRRARIPFLLAQKKKKKKEVDGVGMVIKRSKSTTSRHFLHQVDSDELDAADHYNTSHKRGGGGGGGFWSFLNLSSSRSSTATATATATSTSTSTSTRKMDKGASADSCAIIPNSRDSNSNSNSDNLTASLTQTLNPPLSHKSKKEVLVKDESDSPNNSHSMGGGRKVSRSRSVGCGSRSFSGDLFERISTGFGDCTLRRVESQREGKVKSTGASAGAGPGPDHQCIIKERVKCGGIFGGFIITSSSSSSSSSSYWISSSVEDNGTKSSAAAAAAAESHGRSKSWVWAFASPMRALTKPPSSSSSAKDAGGKRGNNKPNLAAIPSLLAVGG